MTLDIVGRSSAIVTVGRRNPSVCVTRLICACSAKSSDLRSDVRIGMVQLHTHDARTFNRTSDARNCTGKKTPGGAGTHTGLYRYYCKNPLLPQMFREVFAPEVRVVQLITR